MTDVSATTEYETLRRYASFMARFAAVPVAIVWLEGRTPALYTNNARARDRVASDGGRLESLCAALMRANKLVSVENARSSSDPIAEAVVPVGTALLSYPVKIDGTVVGCVAVVDDLSRGWFSDDVSAIMEIAEAVSTHVSLQAGIEQAQAAYAQLEQEHASLLKRIATSGARR